MRQMLITYSIAAILVAASTLVFFPAIPMVLSALAIGLGAFAILVILQAPLLCIYRSIQREERRKEDQRAG